MKNILIVVGLIAALGVGGYFGYQHFTKSSAGGGVAEVVPEGAVVVIQFSDIQMNLSKWTSTPLWNQLMRIDYEGIARHASDEAKALPDFKKIQKKIEEITSNDIFKKVFDKEAAIVIYPTKLNLATMSEANTAEMFSKVNDMMSSFVFVLKVPLEIQMAEFVSRFVKDLGPNVTQSEEEYKNRKIHLIHYDDANVSVGYVRMGETIVMGLGVKPAQNSIDVLEGDKLPLSEDRYFNDIQEKFLANSGMRIYWNMENSINLFMDELHGMRSMIENNSVGADGTPGVKQWQDIEKALNEMKRNFRGFKALGLSISLDENALTKMDILYNINGLSPEISSIYSKCLPNKNSTVNFVPAQVLSYQWFSCLDLQYYWNQIQKEFDNLPTQSTETAEQKIAQFESVLGMPIDSLIGAFGSEIGGYLMDLKTGGIFPTPLLTFFIEVGDKSSMDQLLGKLNDLPMVMLKDEIYGGTTVYYLGMQFGPDIQPAYAYVGDYFLVSISRKLLKESIDLYNDSSNALVSDLDYKNSPLNLTTLNNGILFIRVGEIAGKVKGFLKWANQWADAKTKKQQAFAAGSEKRLADEKQKIVDLDKTLIKLDDELWSKESNDEIDPASISALKKDIDVKRKELVVAHEEVESLEEIVGQHRKALPDPKRREYILKNLVNPMLDAFSSVGVASSKSVMNKGHIEMTFSVDVGL